MVVKVGTSTLAYPGGRLNIRRTELLCKVLSDLKNAGNEVILVSSGAIGMGVGKLGLAARPKELKMKQAAAAVGQCELMYVYDRLFTEYNHTVAQLLLTGADFQSGERHENFRGTMFCLLSLGVLPVINENDTVATEEIQVGDNDTLSALVADSVGADLLVLLSDIDGLYTADPHKDPEATLIPQVDELTDEILAFCGDTAGSLGTGGMRTKLRAAQICMKAGCDMVIANGSAPEALYEIAAGKPCGTRFIGRKQK